LYAKPDVPTKTRVIAIDSSGGVLVFIHATAAGIQNDSYAISPMLDSSREALEGLQ